MRARNEAGFTLVEIVVVMLILGILLGIAIPMYISQKEKANDAAAQADLSTLVTTISGEWTEEEGTPTVTHDGVDYLVNGQVASRISEGVELVTFTAVDRHDWCVEVRHPAGRSTVGGLRYRADGGYAEGSC